MYPQQPMKTHNPYINTKQTSQMLEENNNLIADIYADQSNS